MLLAIAAVLIGCEKEIEVDIPPADIKIVVEGSIEPGQPPLVILTRSQSYFEPTDLSALEDMYVNGAQVTVSTGDVSVDLTEICTSDLPPELIPIVTEMTGFTAEQLAQFNICVYSTFNPAIFGEENKEYRLDISHGDTDLYAVTKIPTILPLDSVWFELAGTNDSLGFAHGFLTDPDTTGNAYRWYTKRINHYPEWSQHAGEQKDGQFMAPFQSVNDDAFFNGLQFEFLYSRPVSANSSKEDDNNDERGYFKLGDTIAVRACTIDHGVFRFFYSMESQIGNQGSPFAVPFELETNIQGGGLGIWAGYGVHNDTIICE